MNQRGLCSCKLQFVVGRVCALGCENFVAEELSAQPFE